jgi:hypothetical protein
MRIFLGLVSLPLLLLADFSVSGHFDLDSQLYPTSPSAKHENSFTAKQTLELTYAKDDLTLFSKLYAQEDYYDTLSKEEHNDRTFLRLDELHLKYDFMDDSIEAGKSIKFWGALEFRNIVDAFNPDDFRVDMFNSSKLGVWNIAYSHFTDNAEISLIVKLEEQEQKMPAYPYVYYFLPQGIAYEESLESSNGVNRPSIYLKYSGSTDTEYPLDFALIYENGYDSQRYFTTNATAIAAPTEFRQKAYLVNKFMTYNTLVVNATLIKLEALYAKVDGAENVGDYSHIAFGVEHTLENFENGAALGLIAEYYRYDTYEDDKYNDLQLFETMQNDVFLGARYTFNNEQDSSVVGGVVADVEYAEQTYYMQFESRFMEAFKVAFDYYYVNPSQSTLTAYKLLEKHQRVGLNVAWYF